MKKYEFHPVCELLPDMPKDEFEKLVKDIEEHGQLEPAIVHKGKIIDGRHRYKACLKLGIELKIKETDTDEHKALVASLNLFRRHLDNDQRALLRSELLSYDLRGGDRSKKQTPNLVPSISQVANEVRVSSRKMKQARTVTRGGGARLKKSVAQGEVPLYKAAQVATLPKSEQVPALDALKPQPRGGMVPKVQVLYLVDETERELLSAYSSCDGRTVKTFAKALREKLSEMLTVKA